jgi:L,D-transpeptidase catalytic domain
MRGRLLNPWLWCLIAALLVPPALLRAGEGKGAKMAEKSAFAAKVSTLYEQINLKEVGLSKKALAYALKGYYYLLAHHKLARTNILSICDLSQSSRNKRLYVLDLEQKTILINTYVAHGRNSGKEFATSFSNSAASHKSSLGFFVTEDTYFGNNGLSLKICGMERGINDGATRRNIVIHGSPYVGADFMQMNHFINGRSYGCPAVPQEESETIIDAIKGGSCLFIYHPTKKYSSRSKILNA